MASTSKANSNTAPGTAGKDKEGSSEKKSQDDAEKSKQSSSQRSRQGGSRQHPKLEVLYTAKDPRFPTYCIIDKLYLPIEVDAKSFSFALSYRPSKDDIIIISYPKCGGVWVAQIVYLLLNDCVPLPDIDNFSRVMPNLEEDGYQLLKQRGPDREPTVVRTHLPYHKMRINPMAKYIYITRNPKDCCVALYQYTVANEAVFRFKNGTLENFFEWFIRGRVCYNDYFDHIIPYWLHRKDCHVLFCTYENMTLDHKSHIFMIANFIGGVAGTMVKDRHMLKKLIHRSSFAYMYNLYKDPANLGNMVKGRIGEWKTALSPAQATRLDHKFYARFGKSEIANLWRYIVRFQKPGKGHSS